jgi:prepilin-type processing-associated H-X9-DG protein
VLVALPALLANGLLDGIDTHFPARSGFYPQFVNLLMVAILALRRIPSLEQLRLTAPGEMGLLLGLDRCPEVKTMRARLADMAQPEAVAAYSSQISRRFLESDPELAGVLYVDGHVRLYHGTQTKLPTRFVSRQRLCLRSFVDYWVCDQEGQPVFVVPSIDTQGLLHHLRADIIPRLINEMPNPPTQAELDSDPNRSRFQLIFDREGYSPKALVQIWKEHRVAGTTYRRHPYEAWPDSAFTEQVVTLAFGVRSDMRLAEQPFGSQGLREIRRLTDRGTQTAIVTADRAQPMAVIAGRMFSRWNQENYFRFATQDFGIDRLAGYGLTDAPESTVLVNPAWRIANAQVRKLQVVLRSQQAERGRLTLPPDPAPAVISAYQQRAADLASSITTIEADVTAAKAVRTSLKRHITLAEIPKDQRPQLIDPYRKHLIDTIKMIAFRAETAQAMILRDHLARHDDGRAIAKAIYRTEADMLPDPVAKTLTIRLHRLGNDLSDRAAAGLLAVLNQAECCYPGTDMVLRYELVSEKNPQGQDP